MSFGREEKKLGLIDISAEIRLYMIKNHHKILCLVTRHVKSAVL